MASRYVHDGSGFVELGGGVGGGGPPGSPPTTSDAVNTAASDRSQVTCTTSATPHTWGSWVEVDASLSVDVLGLYFSVFTATLQGTVNTSTLLQVGVGAGGAESAVSTISVGYQNITDAANFMPLCAAAGSRVAVRAQSAVGSKNITGSYAFAQQPSTPLTTVTTIGDNTTTSQGVTLTAPGSLNTKGAWTELTASSAADIEVVNVSVQGAGGTSMNASGVLVDIGVGAASSETVVIADLAFLGSSSEGYFARQPLVFGVSIPAGSRIVGRYARASANNAVDLILTGAG